MECGLGVYGKPLSFTGEKTFIPFRYQGQYYDRETELAYNRFRYYSPESGTYMSQDPIGFHSGEPNFYAYVRDSNAWVDVFGLSKGSGTLGRNLSKAGMDPFTRGNFQAHHVIPHEVWVDNQQFFDDIGLGGAKDKASKGVFLPKNADVAQQGGFDYYHRGSHPGINTDMGARVNAVKQQFDAGEISATQARKKISAIQKAERKRLSSRKGKTPVRCH